MTPSSSTENPGLARQVWHQLEPVHALFWYSPDVFAEAEALGYRVDARWPSYFAWVGSLHQQVLASRKSG